MRLKLISLFFSIFPELFSHYLILTVSFYIMSTNQAESSPIPATVVEASNDVPDKINFLNLQCQVSSEHRTISKASLSDEVLRERLVAVLISCHSALHQTKSLTDSYVSLKTQDNMLSNDTNSTELCKVLRISLLKTFSKLNAHALLNQTNQNKLQVVNMLNDQHMRSKQIG